MKKPICFALTVTLILTRLGSQAFPLVCTDRPDELTIFPHSLCIADFICTGTPISTNGGYSAEFAVDEILWGSAPSTNVTIRRDVPLGEGLGLQFGERYLVCAFTNDWWSMGPEDYFYYAEYTLSKCVTETNRPPNSAVFDDYVLIENKQSAIPFSDINYGGTNYWDAVRTLTTNIIDVAKHKGDDDWVRNKVLSILADPQKRGQLPLPIIRQLVLYKMFFYDRGMRLEQP